MRAKLPPRILGPYQDRDKWRLILVENGQKENQIYATKEEALRAQRRQAKAFLPMVQTVEAAINDWVIDRQKVGTCKELTVASQAMRVRFMLRDHMGEEITRVTAKTAELIYEKHRTRPTKKGLPLAAATHNFDLKCAKNFFKWCVSRRYLVSSPFSEVRPVGKKRAGKPQLRIEEAKRFTDAGLSYFAATQNPLAVAALVAITMGPRASEVLNRSVRDLDNGGKILVIDSGKNERAKRRLDVPLFLQPILLQLAQGRDPLAKLFGLNAKGDPWRRQSLYSVVHKVCKRAQVPLVCTHSLRGFWATTSVQIGTPSQAVAATLGHGSFAITERHYAAPGSRQNAGTHLVVETLLGESPAKPSAADILARLDAQQVADLLALLTKNGPLNRSATVSQADPETPSATGGYGTDHIGGNRGRHFNKFAVACGAVAIPSDSVAATRALGCPGNPAPGAAAHQISDDLILAPVFCDCEKPGPQLCLDERHPRSPLTLLRDCRLCWPHARNLVRSSHRSGFLRRFHRAYREREGTQQRFMGSAERCRWHLRSARGLGAAHPGHAYLQRG